MVRAITDPAGTAAATGERLAWNISDDLTAAADQTLGASDYDVTQLDQMLQDHPDAANHEHLSRLRDELAEQNMPQHQQTYDTVEDLQRQRLDRGQQQDLARLGITTTAAFVGISTVMVDNRHDRHADPTWPHHDQQHIRRQDPQQGERMAPDPTTIRLEPYLGPDPYERQNMPNNFMPGDYLSLPVAEKDVALMSHSGRVVTPLRPPTPWAQPW